MYSKPSAARFAVLICARLLPALSLALVLLAIAWLNPRAISYFGFNLMLSLARPHRAGHRGADVRHRRQRSGSVHRLLSSVLSVVSRATLAA